MTNFIPLASRPEPHETTGPTGLLRHEHEVFLRALGLLEGMADGLKAWNPVDRTALAWLIDFFRTFVDQCHHGKEERHLFPALERRGIPRDRGPLVVMLDEHEQGRALLRAMTQADDRAVAKAIRDYAALLRGHIAKENDILFPIAEQVLDEDARRELVEAFDAVERETMGPGIHERLRARLEEIERSR